MLSLNTMTAMTNAEQIQKDEEIRERIVKETGRNFFVEASAGSGKTTLLVKRMAAMVSAGIPVDKITAITFTKAAAKEFYSRFQVKLSEMSNDPELTEVERERCGEALRNVDLCFMGTIDSFCNMVISEHPSEAGVPSNSSVKTDEEMEKIYQREYLRALRGNYGPELQKLANSFRKYQERPMDAFKAAIPLFMNSRTAEHIYEIIPDTDIDEEYALEIQRIRDLFSRLLSHPEIHYAKNKDVTGKIADLRKKQPLIAGSWNDRPSEIIKILKDASGIRTSVDPGEAGIEDYGLFEPHASGKKISWYELKLTEEGSLYEKLSRRQYSVTVQFMEAFAKTIAETLKRNGELCYFDYILYLRDMLKRDAEGDGSLIRHIYDRHSYFLIDESQDTDPLQSEIFFYLSAENPLPDWMHCVPRPGSIFIVGDPKQSIYRFKGADVSSFLKVKSLFKDPVGEVVYLYRNFRSTKKLTAYFNRQFSELLPEETEAQSRFDEIPFGSQYAEDEGLTGAFTFPTQEFSAIALIQNLVHNPDYLIREAYDKPLRQIEYRDIMVITAGKKSVRNYMEAFNEVGVPFVAEGASAFDECSVLSAAAAVLKAAANPADPACVYYALTSDAFDVYDCEIKDWVNAGNSLKLFSGREGKEEPVAVALNALALAASELKNENPSAMFDLVLKKFQIPEKSGSAYLEYAFYARQLLRQAEAAGEISTIDDTAEFLFTLIEGRSGLERTLSLNKSENKVHIANLHKVKGLEAPVVLLDYQQRRQKAPDARTEHNEDGTKQWIFRIGTGGFPDVTYAQTANYADVRDREREFADAEYIRLLYVAATRAKSLLFIPTSVRKDGSPEERNYWYPLTLHVNGDIFSFYKPEEISVSESESMDLEKIKEETVKENALKDRTSDIASYGISRPSQTVIHAKSSAEDEYDDQTDEEAKAVAARRNAALMGTMIHKMMEVLVSSGNKLPLPELVEHLSGEYDLTGADGPELKRILLSVGETICSGGYEQGNGLPADILGELLSAEEVHCEVPFSRRDGNTIWHGIMDVVYRKNGEWHIVDYKSNADESDLDSKYLAQLDAYRDAFLDLTGECADARTYHISV